MHCFVNPCPIIQCSVSIIRRNSGHYRYPDESVYPDVLGGALTVILDSQDELRLFIFIKSLLSSFKLFSLARNRSAVFYKKIMVNTAPAKEIFTVPDNREAAAYPAESSLRNS